jgi:hypothetical protein
MMVARNEFRPHMLHKCQEVILAPVALIKLREPQLQLQKPVARVVRIHARQPSLLHGATIPAFVITNQCLFYGIICGA